MVIRAMAVTVHALVDSGDLRGQVAAASEVVLVEVALGVAPSVEDHSEEVVPVADGNSCPPIISS